MSQASAAAGDVVASALTSLARWDWPVTGDDLPALVDALGWSIVPGGDDEFVQAQTSWPVTRPEAFFSLHSMQLTSVSFRLTDVLTDDTSWREDFLTDSFAAAFSVARAALGEPSTRVRGSTPTAFWELASGGRITISRTASSVTCTVHSAEYAAVMRTLAT